MNASWTCSCGYRRDAGRPNTCPTSDESGLCPRCGALLVPEDSNGRFARTLGDEIDPDYRVSSASGPTLVPEGRHGPPPRLPRTRILPGYEVLGELGRGGTGVVYKARQIALQRMGAVK